MTLPPPTTEPIQHEQTFAERFGTAVGLFLGMVVFACVVVTASFVAQRTLPDWVGWVLLVVVGGRIAWVKAADR